MAGWLRVIALPGGDDRSHLGRRLQAQQSCPQSSLTPTVRGNGSVTVAGPRTIYLHLKGEEDACDVEITIFPKQGG